MFIDGDLQELKDRFLDDPIHSAEELDKFFAKHGRALLERLGAAEAVTKQAMRLRAAWIHHDEGPVLKDLIVAWERTVWRNPEA